MTGAPAQRCAASSSAPELELPRLRKIQREEWPLKISEAAVFFLFDRLLELFAGNRLTAQNHRDQFLLIDRGLIAQCVRQRIVLAANPSMSPRRPLLAWDPLAQKASPRRR